LTSATRRCGGQGSEIENVTASEACHAQLQAPKRAVQRAELPRTLATVIAVIASRSAAR
jgi:hypothetical protein